MPVHVGYYRTMLGYVLAAKLASYVSALLHSEARQVHLIGDSSYRDKSVQGTESLLRITYHLFNIQALPNLSRSWNKQLPERYQLSSAGSIALKTRNLKRSNTFTYTSDINRNTNFNRLKCL